MKNEKEFNLSEKIHDVSYYSERTPLIYSEDVKEFIERIFDEIEHLNNLKTGCCDSMILLERIQVLAGDKLI